MIKRGDVYYAELNPTVGSEQKGYRPIVIIQNDIGNEHSSTTIAAIITSHKKKYLPTHVHIKDSGSGLSEESIVMLEQIRTIDKRRLGELIGHIGDETMARIEAAILCSIGIIKS